MAKKHLTLKAAAGLNNGASGLWEIRLRIFITSPLIFLCACFMAAALYSCGHHTCTDGHSHSEMEDEHETTCKQGGIYLSPEQEETAGLEFETIAPSSFHQIIRTSGEILSAQGEERTISATMSGTISFNKASLATGISVNAGETIASISSRDLAEGDQSQKAIISYNMARQEFERAESLIKDRLISQREYNTIKLSYENARLAFEAAGKNRTAKGNGVVSPIKGFIKKSLVSEGEFVEIGQPLFIVTRNLRLKLKAELSERYYKDLDDIVSANFRTPYDKEIYKLADMNGKLISYGKSAPIEDCYLPVNFEFDNIKRLVPGSFVEIYLISRPKPNTLTVPVSALIEEQGIYSVFISCEEGSYEKREIGTGQNDGERVEILSGLKEGEKVVTKGAYHLRAASVSKAIPHSHEH